VTTPDYAVQLAFYALLNGHVGAPVFDEPPETTNLPYVTIGEATTTRDNRFGQTGRQVLAGVHVWTRSGGPFNQGGFKSTGVVAEAVDALLDGATLDLSASGWHAVGCDLDQSQTLRDPDGTTRHVVLTYRVWVEAA